MSGRVNMTSSETDTRDENKVVSKLGTIGKYSDIRKKYHVMIPKQFIDELDAVKIAIEDEI
jgi:hypothetical protein